MTGGGLVGLTLLSMGWLFFLGGTAFNYQALSRAPKGKRALRRGLGPLPGVVGSVTAFFSVPAVAKLGVVLAWPWLWILLPLVIDPMCLVGLVRLLRRQ
ncbi:MAG: hypothetical protein ABR570_09640 [Burkholderiales bacterium]